MPMTPRNISRQQPDPRPARPDAPVTAPATHPGDTWTGWPVWWAGTASTAGATTVNPTMAPRACHRGRPVDSEAKHPVVILYEHPLLGERLAKYLRSQCGVEVMVACGHDLQAVTSALALGPAVVIFELSDPPRQVDLIALAPKAVLIEVSTVMARGQVLSPDAAVLEKILAVVSGSSGHQSSPKDQG